MRALRPVTRSGGSVLKAPQRRRGGTPPRAEPGAYRYPKPCIPCILGHERPRVARPRSCGGNRLREAGAPSSRRLCQSLLGRRARGHCPRRRLPVTRSGGSVLKAPQRRRGGTPPRAETGAYRHPYPCILKHEKPRVFSPHGEKDTGSSAKRLSEWA